MMRYMEYLYLLGAVVAAGYLALNFKDLPTSNKVFLAVVVVFSSFMFSFRRKQRQVLEGMEADQEDASTEDDETNNPEKPAPDQ